MTRTEVARDVPCKSLVGLISADICSYRISVSYIGLKEEYLTIVVIVRIVRVLPLIFAINDIADNFIVPLLKICLTYTASRKEKKKALNQPSIDLLCTTAAKKKCNMVPCIFCQSKTLK